MSHAHVWWVLVVACVYNTNIATFTNWILPNSTLPRPDFGMAVGYYNGSIFIIGGQLYSQQLTVLNTTTLSFTDFGTNVFNGSIEGRRQFSTQNGRFIYTINSQTPHLFGVFDMNTKQYTSKWINTSHIRNSSNYECLASSTNHLFAVASKQIQMLDLITSEWMQNLPEMNDYKFNFVCLVHNDTLLVFGRFGGFDVNVTVSNEAIIITDIAHNSWQYFTSQPVGYPGPDVYDKAVAHQNNIYLTTGDYFYVYVYDTAADNWTEPLSWERIFSPALIVIDNSLYAFGGHQLQYTDDYMMLTFERINTWTYYQLRYQNISAEPITTFPIANTSTQTSTAKTFTSFEPQNVTLFTAITGLITTAIRKSSITTNDDVENGNDEGADNSDNNNIWLMLGVAAGSVCLTLFVGIFIGICWQRKQQRDQYKSSQNIIQQQAGAKAENANDADHAIQPPNLQQIDNDVVAKDVVDSFANNMHQRESVNREEDEEGLQITQEGQKEPEAEASEMTTKSAVVTTKEHTRRDSVDIFMDGAADV